MAGQLLEIQLQPGWYFHCQFEGFVDQRFDPASRSDAHLLAWLETV